MKSIFSGNKMCVLRLVNTWSQIKQKGVIFTHLKLWVAVASHNFKWVNHILIALLNVVVQEIGPITNKQGEQRSNITYYYKNAFLSSLSEHKRLTTTHNPRSATKCICMLRKILFISRFSF